MNIIKQTVRGLKSGGWKPLNRVGIIGALLEKGQKKQGVNLGPAALRDAGLIQHLKEIPNLDIKDYGDIRPVDCIESDLVENMRNLKHVSEFNKQLTARVAEVIKDDRVALTIGGDHAIGLGTVEGHRRAHEDVVVLWVDAHADINTNSTSGSGSIHGMPVALLASELTKYWPKIPSLDWHIPKFSLKNIGYIGLRSVDNYEKLIIEKFNIPAYSMEDVVEHGIRKSVENILNRLDPDQSKPIHVSFDIDALDSLEAPSTGTPVRGGLSLREGVILMEMVQATGRLRGIDLVEINPALGDATDRARTIEAGLYIIRAALGFPHRGQPPIGVKDLPIARES